MTNYREILRLQALGINKQETAASVGCSRNTVLFFSKKQDKSHYPPLSVMLFVFIMP